MTALLVDVGNSRVKWARCERGVLAAQQAAPHAGWAPDDWRAALFGGTAPDRVVAASVAGGASLAALDAAARAATRRGIERIQTQREAGGIVNGYADHALLGVDRWLAMVGARQRTRDACVVVDIGTAATVDVVAPDGRHRGGYIVPGPRLMVASLLQGTRDLAGFHAASPAGAGPAFAGPAFADNTRDAIERGSRVALAAWVDRCVRDAEALLGTTPRLLLTGGGASELRCALETPAEDVPDLVLRGLAVVAAA